MVIIVGNSKEQMYNTRLSDYSKEIRRIVFVVWNMMEESQLKGLNQFSVRGPCLEVIGMLSLAKGSRRTTREVEEQGKQNRQIRYTDVNEVISTALQQAIPYLNGMVTPSIAMVYSLQSIVYDSLF